MNILSVENLKVEYRLEATRVLAVNGVSFTVGAGESIGIVGESGCGKTTIAKAILRILPTNGEITGGRIQFKDVDLVALPEEEMRRRRWKDISLISQSAMNSLNPVYTIGRQIVEAIQVHEKVSFQSAWSRAERAFDLVGLEAKRLRAYPHQLSGGMRQRGVIAMALILQPSLIIADEPTTALDVLIQDRILKEMVSIQKMTHTAMIFITHDIGVVAETCQRVVVMYAGVVAEIGDVETVFSKPCHPYTMGLQNAFPKISAIDSEMISIPGHPPSLVNPPPGCLFAERCPFAGGICRIITPPQKEISPRHIVSCHFADKAELFRMRAREKESWFLGREARQIGKAFS